MRTVGRIRYETGQKAPVKTDSFYKPIARRPFESAPLVIPKVLQKELPYRLKPKVAQELRKKEEKLVEQHTAVILEPHESKIHQFMEMVDTLYEEKQKKDRQALEERVKKHRLEMAELDAQKVRGIKKTKKKICRALSKREQMKLRKALDSVTSHS
ncbi:unnamed protein product [Gongylonema pulchrum]|uniref:DUF4200 domain-containing protein n=1 Tax=Gongylonema pulchrum TaxID=637853 RepID=A0A183EFN4_9BILA|nr:unnamed protein product [Gongylonema pulchrum]